MNIQSLSGPAEENQYQNLVFFKPGGMGEIYTANDVINSKKVAIKVLGPVNTEDMELLSSEAKVSLSLRHRNIVETYYTSQFLNNDKVYFYTVMELLENGSLREAISNSKEFIGIEKAIKYMIDLASGLSEAHKIVIHRDLKPENILISNDDELKICDFGLARYIDATTRSCTYKGWGTSPYRAPECWLFEQNTVSMDIYSLGIVYFELLTLRQPFLGKNDLELREQHLFQPLPDLQVFRSDIPIRLVQMINKMTQKRSKDRYESFSEIIKVLKSIENELESNDHIEDELLKKANDKILKTEAEKLSHEKILSDKMTEQQLLKYSVDTLFSQVLKRVDSLNKNLETRKIVTTQKSFNSLFIGQFNDLPNLTLQFMENKIEFSFFIPQEIQRYVDNLKEKSISRQRQRYGLVIEPPQDSFFKKDGVCFVGMACYRTGNIHNNSYGFNIILRRTDPNDLYGEWWVCWFDDSALVYKTQLNYHYPLKSKEFYEEYEYGRSNTMHVRNMNFTKFTQKHIDDLLGKLFES